MKDILKVNIDNLSKDELCNLKEKINDFVKPYNNKTSEIYNKIREIEKQEYLANRGIKNYPVLNELIAQLGDTYKDVIIDIDEFLGGKRYSSIRIYNEVEKACDNHGIKFTYELANIVEVFLINNNIIRPEYEICCSRCNDRILLFSSNPRSNTFVEDLKREFNDCLNIDGNNIYCDNCEEEIDLRDEYNISQSDFYKIIREGE